jgi:DNA primase
MVASLGTALTGEQARLLRRFARRVVVNYDGDRAGVNAAKRAIEVLLPEDFEVKVLVLPEGADPDEFVRARGVEEYTKLRGQAVPHVQFVIEQALAGRDLKVPAQKAEAVEEVLPVVRATRNAIQRREYFDMVMDALRVEEPGLRQELWKSVGARTPDKEPTTYDVKEKVILAETPELTVAEQRLLELLFHDDELRREIVPRISESDYEDLPSASIFYALICLENRGEQVDSSSVKRLTEGDPTAANIIGQIQIYVPERAEGEATDQFLAEAESCLTTLRLMRLDRRIKELASEIARADRAGDNDTRDRLVMEDLELKRRRTALLPRAGSVTPGGHSQR